MSASNTQSATMLPAQEAYALWASTYDQTPNPLLSLEERHLSPVLNTFVDRDIVDLGCGTGRWLQHLEASDPRSLTGVDSSPAMLAEGRKKCRKSTVLIQANSTAIPLPDRSADCVLASFLLSYMPYIPAFAGEIARILRPGGTLIISDLHPDVTTYGWRRTFRSAGNLFEIATFPYTFFDLIVGMHTAGFRLELIDEPCFGEEEAAIFRENGMLERFRQVESLPVIYWARFSRREN
jgi:ubiquinone/menaquinone biosynthesis C-methylase UbiE